MTIRTEKPEIFFAIIISATVDMVNRQHQRLAIPNGFHSTQHTAKRYPYFNHRSPQSDCLLMLREWVTQNEDFGGGRFAWPTTMTVALISRSTEKVVSADSVLLH